MKIKLIIFSAVIFTTNFLFSQSLTDNPCSEPALSEWTVGGGCVPTSTSGFTPLFNPTSCNSGAFNDGWAWYTGTGFGNTITYTPDPGFDAIIHLFEVPDPAVCSVIELGCSDNAGAGGTETIVGGGVSGTLYYIRIQLLNSNTAMTGCLGIVANPATCDDGIQNGTETCVDAGGSCPYGCPPPTSSSSSPCSNTVNTTVDVITCDLIGTPGFTETSGIVDFSGVYKGAMGPEPAACGYPGGNKYVAWATYDILTGVSTGSFYAEDISATKDINYVLYEGTCASLTVADCGLMLELNGVGQVDLNPVNFSGLDPTKTYHLMMYSTSAWSLSSMFQGFAGTPTNDNCASSEIATGPGCNVGATPSNFLPPGAYGYSCTGGGWTTNENTVFYNFTPDSVNATLEITAIECNDGNGGNAAQFGVWNSCAAVNLAPTAANGFLGCAVGTSPLSLSGLDTSQTYIIAVDGTAGSICAWDFYGDGIILPITLIEFNATLKKNNVFLEWYTESEKNNDFFTIEKSIDARNYEVVGVVDGAGNSNNTIKYNLIDEKPNAGVSYYRLKQTDFDGNSTYSEVKVVDNISDFQSVEVYPNPSYSNTILSITNSFKRGVSIKIVDVSGRVLLEKNTELEKGVNKINLQTDWLSSGIYFIDVKSESISKNIKFMKK